MFPPCRLSSSLLKAAREESPEEGAGAAPGLGLSCTSRVPGPGLGWHHQQGGDSAQPGRDSGESAQRFCILSLTHLPAKRQKCRILHPVAAAKLRWGDTPGSPSPTLLPSWEDTRTAAQSRDKPTNAVTTDLPVLRPLPKAWQLIRAGGRADT